MPERECSLIRLRCEPGIHFAFCLFSLHLRHHFAFCLFSLHLRHETFVGERTFLAMSILKQLEREANTVRPSSSEGCALYARSLAQVQPIIICSHFTHSYLALRRRIFSKGEKWILIKTTAWRSSLLSFHCQLRRQRRTWCRAHAEKFRIPSKS